VRSRLGELVGCELPLQLAAMGRVGTTELAAEVIASGGLGMVPSGVAPAPGACGVNFLMPFDPSLEAIEHAASIARAVELFFGDPRQEIVDVIHRSGALAGWQVGSVREALAAQTSGCDYVVIQGIEAGGHVRSNLPLNKLLPATLSELDIPVVAAGGVATAERLAELMRIGADAIRVGTRFVTCPEAGAHPGYVRALLAAGPQDTVLTEWFDEGWTKAPHRVLRSALDAARFSGWRKVFPPDSEVVRDPADMALYAGMGVGSVTRAEPARAVVADLMRLVG
jgi:nitronate monooxygenase